MLVVLPIGTLVIVWTNHVHNLLWRESAVMGQDGLAIAAQRYGSWYWLNRGNSYVLIVDEDGDIAYVNPRAATLFDLERSEALGTPIDDIVRLADVELDAEAAFGEIDAALLRQETRGDIERVVGNRLESAGLCEETRIERRP